MDRRDFLLNACRTCAALALLPAAASLEGCAPSAKAIVDSKVDITELMGHEVILNLMTTSNKPFLARVDPRTKARVGSSLGVAINLDNMHIFDKQTEKAIR